VFRDEETHTGHFNKQFKLDGKGCTEYAKGHSCFEDGKLKGPGIQSLSSGHVYEGAYLDNLLENGKLVYLLYGKGWKNFSDGSVYDVDWLNDKRSGIGYRYYSSGDSYDMVSGKTDYLM
jgi:hypothetical protein